MVRARVSRLWARVSRLWEDRDVIMRTGVYGEQDPVVISVR